MTQLPEPQFAEGAPCPQCGAPAEPEQDGLTVYLACPNCGSEFGYRRISQSGPACAAGLPIDAQARAGPGPVFLGATIARRPE